MINDMTGWKRPVEEGKYGLPLAFVELSYNKKIKVAELRTENRTKDLPNITTL
jgi:hypothetical protein